VPDAPPLDLARVAQRIGSIAREYTELCLKGAPRYSERTSRRKWSCPAGGGPEVPGNLGASHLNRNRRLEKAEYQNYVLLHQHLIVCVSEAKELRDLAARLVEELSRRRGELVQKNYATILEPRIEDLKVEYLPGDAPGIYIYHRPGRVLLRRRRVYYHIDEDKLKSTSPMNEYYGRMVDIISRRYADLKGLHYEHSREIISKELTMMLSRAIKEGSLKSLPDRLARWYEESGNPRVVRYYLSGLRLNAERIELGDGAMLRRPTSADVKDVLSADLWEIAEGSPSYLMGVFSTLLESMPRPSEEGVKISFGVPATPSAVLEWEETGGNDWRQRRADANSYAARLITALVLLGKCYPTPEDPLKQPPLSFHGALSQIRAPLAASLATVSTGWSSRTAFSSAKTHIHFFHRHRCRG
jgi:hypothetical protein